VAAAAARLEGIAHRTPVHTSRTLDARTGARAFLKCESFQRGGAFKFRGAYNALAQLGPEQRTRGVLTFSSGNHAGAMGLAGGLLGVKVAVVMPDDAPAIKLAATRGYGAEVITYDRAQQSREELGRKLAAERGMDVIPPYDHPHVIAGQGTAVKELIEDVGPLDVLLVCCGGGGLLSGSALAARALSPGCRVIGVEPERADDATRSFRTKTLHTVHNPDTIADGARTPSLGRLTFPLVLRHVDDMVTVGEAAIVRAMLFLLERTKLVVEPTGALAAAALLEGKAEVRGARVGVVISGGNLDPTALPALLAAG
jgi:threonine dehydratase